MTREDFWFFISILVVCALGAGAGASVTWPFLLACTVVLAIVWIVGALIALFENTRGLHMYMAWLSLAVPLFLVVAWLVLIGTTWGFVR